MMERIINNSQFVFLFARLVFAQMSYIHQQKYNMPKPAKAKIILDKIDTKAPSSFDKQTTKDKTKDVLQELDKLQNLLFAEKKHAVLIVIQGMDASGKDGLVKHVFGGLNPQGMLTESFKQPTEEELAHDFLWRSHKHAPAKGMIQVFNRSYYEDILITRVHKMIDNNKAKQRMQAINDFETMLTNENILIQKFYLHVSKEKQLERFEERKQDETKRWKYDKEDYKEFSMRKQYIQAYEDCFKHCNKVQWTIVPADQNWYKEYIVANAVCKALNGLAMKYPKLKTTTN